MLAHFLQAMTESRTSSSIFASAMSASLPLPLAIFWASAIWFLTACRASAKMFSYAMLWSYLSAEVLQSVSLYGVDAENRVGLDGSESTRQEELLAAALLFNNLDQTRLQLLDGGDVVGQDTHVTGFRGQVDLDAAPCLSSVFARSQCGIFRNGVDVHILGLVDRLQIGMSAPILSEFTQFTKRSRPVPIIEMRTW